MYQLIAGEDLDVKVKWWNLCAIYIVVLVFLAVGLVWSTTLSDIAIRRELSSGFWSAIYFVLGGFVTMLGSLAIKVEG